MHISEVSLSRILQTWFGLVAIACLFTGALSSAEAQQRPAAPQTGTSMGIAAVVNEDVVTVFDVQSRLGLFLMTSGIQNTQDVQRRLVPQVIDALIDDHLKLQEANRLKIEVTDDEIRDAVARLEARGGMKPGAFRAMVEERGISINSLYSQVKADLAWVKVVRESLQREVNIAPEEVQTVLDRLEENQGKSEYRVSEIFLPLSARAPEQDVRRLADDLVNRARSNTPFPALAQQFSQSPTAAVGGDLGWVLPGDLERGLDQVVSGMTPGQVSDPIRTTTGYHILMLQDRRASGAPNHMKDVLRLSQIYLPTIGGRSLSPARINQLSERIQTEVSSCDQMNHLAEEVGTPGSGPRPLLYAGALPDNVRNAIIDLPPDRVSPPIEVKGARLFVIICERRDDSGLPSPDEIRAQLENSKLQNLARQKLRDLRRQALIDVRL